MRIPGWTSVGDAPPSSGVKKSLQAVADGSGSAFIGECPSTSIVLSSLTPSPPVYDCVITTKEAKFSTQSECVMCLTYIVHFPGHDHTYLEAIYLLRRTGYSTSKNVTCTRLYYSLSSLIHFIRLSSGTFYPLYQFSPRKIP